MNRMGKTCCPHPIPLQRSHASGASSLATGVGSEITNWDHLLPLGSPELRRNSSRKSHPQQIHFRCWGGVGPAVGVDSKTRYLGGGRSPKESRSQEL